MDTIFAQATGLGKAGVAIIRVSGPEAVAGVGRLIDGLPRPRRASLRQVSDLEGNILDAAIVLVFEEDASFTGEKVVELHLHGSIAVVRKVEDTLSELADFRRAEPGEFTRRALYNARLDLAQVEGLGDLIDAETEAQRVQAQRVLGGELSEKVDGWRHALIRAAALLEATIDFAEEDVPVDVMPEVTQTLSQISIELQNEINNFSYSERIRDGFEVAIVGSPNVGKSTLLNSIAKRPAALTSEIAGTTRDVIEVRVDLRGLPVTFLDTAGLRESGDPVEAAGVELARGRAEQADLRILLVEDPNMPAPLDAEIVLRGKADLPGRDGGVSGLTGQGVDALLSSVWEYLSDRSPQPALMTRERHRAAILLAQSGLSDALLMRHNEPEFVAAEIRDVSNKLASIIGRVDVEDVLDAIFAKFCIGK